MDSLPQRTGGTIEDVIERYQSAVFGLALAKTGSRADAEDVFQEVFLAYYQSQKHFHDEEHRKAWLLRTTVNHCRRITASTWRRKTAPLEEGEEAAAPAFSFQTEEENRVWEALSALEEGYRLPLYLYYFQELTTREIGEALSLRPGAVRMRLSRGRDMLREALKGEYFDGI